MIDVREIDAIRTYHGHVYFDSSMREVAQALREHIAARFGREVLGTLHEAPVGPHTKPMFSLVFGHELVGTLMPWLTLNRSGLDILVHPCTDDEIADHRERTVWLGTPVPYNEEFIASYIASKRS